MRAEHGGRVGIVGQWLPMLAIVLTMVFGPEVALAERTSTPTPMSAADAGDTFTVDGAEPHELPADAEQMYVRKVVDGDTLHLIYPGDDWYYVTRIVGINAPESVKPNSPVECYGPEASARLKELLPVGSIVWVTQDVTDEDQYGRRLRHVWLLDADTNEAFLVSEILVRGGYADARHYRPDDEFDNELETAEQDAVRSDVGLWGAC